MLLRSLKMKLINIYINFFESKVIKLNRFIPHRKTYLLGAHNILKYEHIYSKRKNAQHKLLKPNFLTAINQSFECAIDDEIDNESL